MFYIGVLPDSHVHVVDDTIKKRLDFRVTRNSMYEPDFRPTLFETVMLPQSVEEMLCAAKDFDKHNDVSTLAGTEIDDDELSEILETLSMFSSEEEHTLG